MAHLDEKTLEENLKNFKRVPPAATIGPPAAAPPVAPKWFVFLDQFWQGPYAIDELKGIMGFKPETWARPEGDERVKPAFEFDVLRQFFQPAEGQTAPATSACPHCRTTLQESHYEGVPVLACGYCGGLLVDQKGISRILIRKDKEFPPAIARLAELAIKERAKLASGLQQHAGKAAWVLDCPACGQKMRKQYFVYSYPVEIDRCIGCSGTWFDRQELEVLQYIFENKERFFDDSEL
jgi:Zn-finger nucleic acid-binding protein